MTQLSYSKTLTPATPENINDVATTFNEIKTWSNNIDSTNLASVNGSSLVAASVAASKLSQGVTSLGNVNIATQESRTNTAYGTLTTPDQVTGVVLPTNGLLVVAYSALWQNSVGSAGRAAIFLGANQLKVPTDAGTPIVGETNGPTNANKDAWLLSATYGLSGALGSATDGTSVTTGMSVGSSAASASGICYIWAAAGTYTVSIQFKSASGSVSVKERKLWVWVLGF